MIEQELLMSIFPQTMLERFNVVNFKTLGNISTKQMEYEIHLDEKNQITQDVDISKYESKGFLPSSRVQDFPIRGRTVYLVIRRRRWRHIEDRSEVSNDISYIAKGAKLTEEISAFLKETNRYERRYNQ